MANNNNMCEDDDMDSEYSVQQEEEEKKQLKKEKFEGLKKYAGVRFVQMCNFWMEFIKTSCSEVGKNVNVRVISKSDYPYKKYYMHFAVVAAIIERMKNAPLAVTKTKSVAKLFFYMYINFIFFFDNNNQ